MPFSETTAKRTEDYWTKHFKFFLKPLIEECSLEAHRSKPLRGDVTRQIILDLVKSPVVVADLTDANPNVYWELGVRQSFMHGTITIAQEGTKLPFDISSKGTLFYDSTHLNEVDFRKNFKTAIKDCLENSARTDSHVIETLSGRGTLYEIIRREETVRRLDAVLSECDHNLEVFKSIIKQAKTNLDDPQNRKFIAARFRPWAVELLVTNCYVDEDRSFYQLAEKYLDSLVRIDGQLGHWAHLEGRVEDSLLEQEERTTKGFKDFKNNVETVRAKIERKQH
ncbi:MAG: hypothetical protein C5S49_00115 [Candidatus Methanogaster sp.]|nr:MAG: hypothetical protein C5S49_00115 [ANME-2 cluster archaeon]